jgi:hypothetical protein
MRSQPVEGCDTAGVATYPGMREARDGQTSRCVVVSVPAPKNERTRASSGALPTSRDTPH